MSDMVEDLVNQDELFQEKLQEKAKLLEELRSYENKIQALNKERNGVWKKIREMNQYFKHNCNHDWKRENYPYAPLYCTICGYERP